jgi:hypothetical protein|tara:strand:- start:104 stop:355 length:252 start_codon:yes stop_codon:yes gene_type:complete
MNKQRQKGIDTMRGNQTRLMDEFDISSEQFDEIIKLYGEGYGKVDTTGELLRKDITKGYIKDNVVIVSKEISDIIDKVRTEMN